MDLPPRPWGRNTRELMHQNCFPGGIFPLWLCFQLVSRNISDIKRGNVGLIQSPDLCQPFVFKLYKPVGFPFFHTVRETSPWGISALHYKTLDFWSSVLVTLTSSLSIFVLYIATGYLSSNIFSFSILKQTELCWALCEIHTVSLFLWKKKKNQKVYLNLFLSPLFSLHTNTFYLFFFFYNKHLCRY